MQSYFQCFPMPYPCQEKKKVACSTLIQRHHIGLAYPGPSKSLASIPKYIIRHYVIFQSVTSLTSHDPYQQMFSSEFGPVLIISLMVPEEQIRLSPMTSSKQFNSKQYVWVYCMTNNHKNMSRFCDPGTVQER